jgi:collagenase-like PrtC family protease
MAQLSRIASALSKRRWIFSRIIFLPCWNNPLMDNKVVLLPKELVMTLSVAFNFDPALIPRLAAYPDVTEVYGKLDRDILGGGRSTYTLRPTSWSTLKSAIRQAHDHHIAFNYLLNAATLNGMEQTRAGQRAIRGLIDALDEIGVDHLTVASPYLLRLIKSRYPRFKVRVGVFALVNNPAKAKSWEEMGADTLCISATSCNRDFPLLTAIRRAVRCDLQLIANASCLPDCTHELAHMNLMTASSRTGDANKGFCLDYCFLHCSAKKLREPLNYIRSTWIRPEDLVHYQRLGYTNFKLVERSCSTDLLVKRVAAYSAQSFDGNLLEIAGPVAQVGKEQGATAWQRMRMAALMARPLKIKIASLLKTKRYAQAALFSAFDKARAPVYIDNRALDGFLAGQIDHSCFERDCGQCGYCAAWADKAITMNETYRSGMLTQADELDHGLLSGAHWFASSPEFAQHQPGVMSPKSE